MTLHPMGAGTGHAAGRKPAAPAVPGAGIHARFKVIVVAAATGGMEALTRILSEMPRDLAATVVAAIHTGEPRSRRAAALLAEQTALQVSDAEEGSELLQGHVYLAPAGTHLVVRDNQRLGFEDGPELRSVRPAADRLFISAARVLRQRVIGVVLTGHGRDGTAGLTEIHKWGGVGVVQSPGEAQATQMPIHAIQDDDPDYIAFLDDIGPLLMRLSLPR